MPPKIVCLRYLLLGTFIHLAIFGIAVCGTGSYLLHELRSSLTFSEWYGPPAVLLTTGIINFILGLYFWHYCDTKYNQAQLLMFCSIVVLIMIVQAGASMWALVSHAFVDSAISDMLESKLASIGTTNTRPAWNVTEIKVNCCGYENISRSSKELEENDDKISWSCCNIGPYEPDSPDTDTCLIFYINECRHFAFHRYRSILFHTFILGLCAMGLQALVMICIKSYSTGMKKWLKRKRVHKIVGNTNEPAENTCASVPLGPHHVCDGCSSAQYHRQ